MFGLPLLALIAVVNLDGAQSSLTVQDLIQQQSAIIQQQAAAIQILQAKEAAMEARMSALETAAAVRDRQLHALEQKATSATTTPTNSAAVNGGLSAWGAWSACDAMCGGGKQSRFRTCTSPPPSLGGADCFGSLSETTTCNSHSCPVDGGLSPWSSWRPCSVTCGAGSQTRVRTCANPPPKFGGLDCGVSLTESRGCHQPACPVARAAKPGSECLKCGDSATQTPCTPLDLILAKTTQCPDATPYCMTDVFQQGTTVTRTKRCVNEADCERLWYRGTSDNSVCLRFNPNIYNQGVVCHFCCYGDRCNNGDVPAQSTWYRP